MKSCPEISETTEDDLEKLWCSAKVDGKKELRTTHSFSVRPSPRMYQVQQVRVSSESSQDSHDDTVHFTLGSDGKYSSSLPNAKIYDRANKDPSLSEEAEMIHVQKSAAQLENGGYVGLTHEQYIDINNKTLTHDTLKEKGSGNGGVKGVNEETSIQEDLPHVGLTKKQFIQVNMASTSSASGSDKMCSHESAPLIKYFVEDTQNDVKEIICDNTHLANASLLVDQQKDITKSKCSNSDSTDETNITENTGENKPFKLKIPDSSFRYPIKEESFDTPPVSTCYDSSDSNESSEVKTHHPSTTNTSATKISSIDPKKFYDSDHVYYRLTSVLDLSLPDLDKEPYVLPKNGFSAWPPMVQRCKDLQISSKFIQGILNNRHGRTKRYFNIL